MEFSFTTTKTLEAFTKGCDLNGWRDYQKIIGCENNYAAITDAYSMLYFKADDIPTDKTSLDRFLRPSELRFPSFQQIVASSKKTDSCIDLNASQINQITALVNCWKPTKRIESFIQYLDGVISLRIGKPQTEDNGFHFNPERIKYYSKVIPKEYKIVEAYFTADSQQLVLTYNHQSHQGFPPLTLIVCLLIKQ